MSKIKALEKLRKLPFSGNRLGIELDVNLVADEIEAEIAERFMKLPIDADGVPIHVGDKLDRVVFGGIVCTVTKLKFDGRDWWYESGDDCFSCAGARHVPRTLEDVLRDVWKEALDYAKSGIWRNPDEVFAERADEIRTILQC